MNQKPEELSVSTAARERPILFSAPMVRALLDGTKTQTRRVCKPMQQWVNQACREVRMHDGEPHHFLVGAELPIERLRCPYGQPGDRLWVRETFLDTQGTGIEHRDSGGQRQRYAFAADSLPGTYSYEARKEYGLKWKPSIYMPRAASRILLEVVSVRVERLSDCSEQDARAEGAPGGHGSIPGYQFSATSLEHYRHIWETINGTGSWDANPWVWVVEFRHLDGATAQARKNAA